MKKIIPCICRYFLLVMLIILSSCEGVNKSFSFVQLCDPQLGMGGYQQDMESLRLAVKQINDMNPDFVLICGDLVHHASDTTFSDFQGIIENFEVPVYLVPGNHDVGMAPTDSTLDYYRSFLGEDYYDFKHKGYTFIVTNSLLWKTNVEGESEKHHSWFTSTLDRHSRKKQNLVVAGHIPLYLEQVDEEENYSNFPQSERAQLLDLFKHYEVAAYLTGHTHRTIILQEDMTQLVSGETSSKNFDGRPLGFRLWEASPDTLSHQFVAIEALLGEESD